MVREDFKINGLFFFLHQYSNTTSHPQSSLEKHFRLIWTVQLQREKQSFKDVRLQKITKLDVTDHCIYVLTLCFCV